MTNAHEYDVRRQLVARLKLQFDTAGQLIDGELIDGELLGTELIETHSAWVILAGEYAWKFKKPVNFGFLDFSTLAQRHYFCQQELLLNRRFAPHLYLNLISITGTADAPRIEEGEHPAAIEYGIKMRRFAQADLLSARAASGQLLCDDVEQIANELAQQHRAASVLSKDQTFGSFLSTRHWILENFSTLFPLLTEAEKSPLEKIHKWFLQHETRIGALVEQRKNAGFVRDCHGDLHLNNMVLLDGRVTFFDCIEFNPELRWIDTINELAFVVMDVQAKASEELANALLNRYLEESGDYAGLSVLTVYLVYRALVRAKVAILRRQQCASAAPEFAALGQEYLFYCALAESCIKQKKPQLILTCGVSGSGKTTLARALARALNLIHLRSDLERKRLFGLKPLDRSGSGLGENMYSPEASAQTYARLFELAEIALQAGFSVILDASFLAHKDRVCAQSLANKLQVGFSIIHCVAQADELQRRVSERHSMGRDASEATQEVLQAQLAKPLAFSDQEIPCVLEYHSALPNSRRELIAELLRREGLANSAEP